MKRPQACVPHCAAMYATLCCHVCHTVLREFLAHSCTATPSTLLLQQWQQLWRRDALYTLFWVLAVQTLAASTQLWLYRRRDVYSPHVACAAVEQEEALSGLQQQPRHQNAASFLLICTLGVDVWDF